MLLDIVSSSPEIDHACNSQHLEVIFVQCGQIDSASSPCTPRDQGVHRAKFSDMVSFVGTSVGADCHALFLRSNRVGVTGQHHGNQEGEESERCEQRDELD